MDAKELFVKVGLLRTKHQRCINNVFIWTSLARDALETAKEDPAFLRQKRFRVPSKVRNKEIARTEKDLKAIVSTAISEEIFYSVFVYVVAQVEAFMNDVMTEILRFDNRRLKTRIKGINHTSKIDVSEVIDSESRDELVEAIIKRELISVFYASPALQLKYFQAVSGIKIDKSLANTWLEIKATRDIIVHNSGIANLIYLQKVGIKARTEEGERLPINDAYFGDSLAAMKSLIGKISFSLQSQLKKHKT